MSGLGEFKPFLSRAAALSPCLSCSRMLGNGIMKTSVLSILLPGCMALLAACSSTPSDRIAKNMPAYEQLPKEQQVKVARGELEKGMTPAAVLLAWGEPEQKLAGQINGKTTERWIYTRGGSGWTVGLGGGGFHGRDSGVGTGIGVTMPLGGRSPVFYDVLFENGKVVSWEAANKF